MSDTDDTTTAPEETTPVEGQEPETEETPTEDQPEEKKSLEDDLPDWARNELKKARGEAANYRVQLREAQENLSKAKTPEEYEAAVNELAQKNAELERRVMVSSVAREFDLPAELADLLKGDDEAALKEHAKVLQKFASPKEPESLSGGLTPDENGEDFDPVATARKARAQRY